MTACQLGTLHVIILFRLPTLTDILMQSVLRDTDSEENSKQKKIGLLTVICKTLYIYNRNLSGYAKITGLRLRQAGCSKEALTVSNKLYDCVSYITINRVLDTFSAQADEKIAELANGTVIHCGDNVDKSQKSRHELTGRSRHDLHMYNNMIYQARIDVSSFSDAVPPHPTLNDIEEVDLKKFFPSMRDQDNLIDRLACHVSDVWRQIPCLKEAATEMSKLPSHKYVPEMSQPSKKAHIGVLLKNEGLPAEMIDIMEYCQRYPTANDDTKVYNICKDNTLMSRPTGCSLCISLAQLFVFSLSNSGVEEQKLHRHSSVQTGSVNGVMMSTYNFCCQ